MTDRQPQRQNSALSSTGHVEHASAVLRATRIVNRLIAKERDRDRLLAGVCRALVDTGAYPAAWIALIDVTHAVVASAHAGAGDKFEPICMQMAAGQLPNCWRIVLPRRGAIALDHAAAPCDECPLILVDGGRKLTLVTRLEYDARLYGMIAVALPADVPDSAEQRALIEEVAEDIAFGVNALELERDRERAADRLVYRTRQLETLADNAPDLIFRVDRDRRHLFVNRAAEEAFGIPRARCLGQTIDTLALPAAFAEAWSAAVDAVYADGQAREIEFSCETRSGMRHFHARVVPETDAEGQPQTVLGIARDVTTQRVADEERAALEAQLRQSQKMEAVGQLAGGVAHDFNNLLTAILGNVELVRERLDTDPPPDDVVAKSLEQIDCAGQRAAALTRQLLAFSRRQVIQPQVLNLNSILADLDTLLRRVIGEQIQLELKVAPDLLPIRADAGQIEQVVMNLVINARDAMVAGGRLRLATENVTIRAEDCDQEADLIPGEYVGLTVADTGVGMSAGTIEHIFEPFFTTKPPGKGTGLGLSTVYGIVRHAGGHIDVDSTVGAGTKFRVLVPVVADRAEDRVAPAASVTHPGGYETILLCEDERSVRELTTQMLERGGYTVLAAENGQQAMKIAHEHDGLIHLLLTDVILPDTNGKAVSDTLRELFPHIRVLFMSGYTADVIAHHGVLAPGVDLVEKPFSLGHLLKHVRAILQRD